MNELISIVSPHTRSIVWLTNGDLNPDLPTYKGLDYLLNGLLTASLNADSDFKGRVIISENFHHPLYVFITKEVKKAEYESFLNLFKKDLHDMNSILVIDDTDSFSGLLKATPKEIQSKLQTIKK